MNLFNAPWLDSARDRKEPYFGQFRREGRGRYNHRLRSRVIARAMSEQQGSGELRPARSERAAEQRRSA